MATAIARVDPVPSGQPDHRRACDDADRPHHVGEDLEVGAAEVQRLLGAGPQQQEGDDVDGETDGADDEHRDRCDLDGLVQTAGGLDQDVAARRR